MVQDRYTVLLSPPNSPRMSDAAAKDVYGSQHGPHSSDNPSTVFHGHGRTGHAVNVGSTVGSQPYNHSQRSDHGYRNSPYAALPSPRSQAYYEPDSSAAAHWTDRNVFFPGAIPEPSTTGIKDTVPASPTDRLTPRSPDSHANQEQEDDDLIESGGDDQENEGGERPPMTAAELRAAKRKMKRFRLTHNQTRFLMSEFARQAHPDAAHRERLAREIPGLSARQVQVWFQNRRAKLKRLTTDDRERMMRSRALPADFDTTQALHSPFDAQAPDMGMHMPALAHYPAYAEHGLTHPRTLDTFRRAEYEQYDQHYASPSTVTPTLGDFAFTPPQSASDHLPPTAGGGTPPFALPQPAPFDRRLPVAMPSSNQTPFPPESQPPRLPLHDRLSRAVGDSAHSPLRITIAYNDLSSSAQQAAQHFEQAAPFSEPSTFVQQRSPLHSNVSNSSLTETGSYGLGFSYPHASPYAQTEQPQPISGQPASDADQYRANILPETTYGAYPSSELATCHMSRCLSYCTQYPSQPLQSNYPRNMEQPPEGHSSLPPDTTAPYQSLPGAQPYSSY